MRCRKRIEALLVLLNLNNRDVLEDESLTDGVSGPAANTVPVPPLAITDPVWKVLIYDKFGQDLISPLLKVNDLREQGITVHMPLYSERLPISDVPAIYFVQPTPENLKRMGEDFAKRLYESYYINFSSAVPRPLLEDLAATSIATGSSADIAQVFDQYLDYVCPDHNLFSLNMEDSYRVLNDPTTAESTIEKMVDKIVGSLFSVLVTLGVVPIIRSQRGAAEVIATKLETKLRDHLLNSRANLFMDSAVSNRSLTRPVLIILDRNLDLTTMLNHTWTYQTLVHDIFDMKLNRVAILDEEKKRKVYDIDVNDFFWKKNAPNPFPQVAEDVDVEINRYKSDVDAVTRSCGVSSLEEVDPNDFNAGAKGLTSAVKQLPELTERKRLLDMHMNIATSLLRTIQERHLDQFFAMEENIMKQTKAQVLEVLRNPKMDPTDKLRLFSIYYLMVENISKDDLAEYEKALVEAGANVSSLGYLKQFRAFTRMTAVANVQAVPQTAANDLLGRFSSISSKFTDHLKDAGVSGHFENLVSGVKNLLPVRKDCPATRMVDLLMENRDAQEIDDYLYLDPKLPRGSATIGKAQRGRTPFTEAIVFVVGGGNYLEAQNLAEYTQVWEEVIRAVGAGICVPC
ncbi:Sec1-like protein [Fimicolochytrium jonesii]|uniref:Sec1-like protein n=1 Tax=Fimicolochytrium jonesii TaxID=1396493 RepID=UPI0022FDD157|nr:Sec1-like protein [Fimicolochytrium jonesii]KAI8816681.1 Sec1-like protein [Fimicolochytrium jonesii]